LLPRERGGAKAARLVTQPKKILRLGFVCRFVFYSPTVVVYRLLHPVCLSGFLSTTRAHNM
jgi:hypothetical protein